MTTQTDLRPSSSNAAPPSHACTCDAPPGRDARAGRAQNRRTAALCAVLLCAGCLCAGAALARTPRAPHAPRAASTPSTAQILAPSAATVPDALPTDRSIYRCGNSYSPRPCADDATQPLAVADPRSDAQRRQAEDVAAREKRLAAWLEAGRRERDRAASAPARARATRGPNGCVETAATPCTPRKPRPRHAVAKAPSAAGRTKPD